MGENKGMDRRGFLKTAALSSLALGATAAMAGCAPTGNSEAGLPSTGSDVSWDKEVDVLVLGSGTGTFAALVAAEKGASVCVVEKGNMWGGTAATSGGGLAVPLSYAAEAAGVKDSKEEVVKYFTNASDHRVDQAVLSSYIDNGNDFLTWLSDEMGWTFNASPLFGDYYEPMEGWIPMGRGSLGAANAEGAMVASQMWEEMRAKLEELGAEILMDTEATQLITDETGAVLGAVCGGQNIKAAATIVATGGFDHNDEMRAKYLPYKLMATCVVPTNTGDGQRMGMDIGASVSFMDRWWGVPCVLTTGDEPQALIDEGRIAQEIAGCDWAMYRGLPGAVVVNKKGKRIGNEAGPYDLFNQSFAYYDTGEPGHVNIPSYLICDAACWATYSMPGHIVSAVGDGEGSFFDETYGGDASAADEVPAHFVKADTLEELAEKLGIDPAGLVAEIEAFNANAAEGNDPVFHRGEKHLDINTTGIMAGSRTDIPNPVLAPLATGPFYGTTYVPGSCSTAGGLTINENAQVVNTAGEPIPNLYAVGCASSGISGGTYVHGGISLGSGGVMSWVAVNHALSA
ncbi:FAD-dependent oxidoreductase [uncultured Adlercreutzia sp.]|uniref:FAD-dependent oxidoreductase n=1 Tax=uncultured Adlercreutzia sp. TaxID=875803 RepID=UPI0025F4BDDE|nr:FAD-dependent oxidoreductase [uncultured Adlercreutzia sp.]